MVEEYKALFYIDFDSHHPWAQGLYFPYTEIILFIANLCSRKNYIS